MKKAIIFGICMMLVIPGIAVTVSSNSPPDKPSIDGPSSGSAGTSYEYGFCTSDPDGDDVYYCVNWGDGSGEVCLGPYASGVCISEEHTWSSQGDYVITVVAHDESQAESEEATLPVSMPKVKQNQMFFLNILEMIFSKISFLRELIFLN